ncbi:MAG TPA: response regulator transcription factor [Blastocatellia bacterium]|jgi:DNA-binding NarL/FixJ family response regulator
MEPQIRVLIIDDHKLFIESVVDFLSQKELSLVAAITNLQELPDRLRSLSADIGLISASIEATSITQLIREIKTKIPGIKIVTYGHDCSAESIVEFIEAGASGYLLKEASLHELVQTIKGVYQGSTSCSPCIAAKVFARITELSRRLDNRAKLRASILTPRERNILELIAAGLGNKEIAQRLNISLFTVKNHVHNILEKFQVKYRREAIRCAYEGGLLKHPWPYGASSQKNVSQVRG